MVAKRCCSEEALANKRRRVAKKVQFAENAEAYPCSIGEMSEEERSTVWYTRKDFDSFLRDRVHTIRVWRSVSGEMGELEEHYCLRGLEPYQSPSLNAEMHSHRYLTLQAIIREQERQRRTGERSDEKLAAAVTPLSIWACQRARRLALMDEEHVRRMKEEDAMPKPQRRSSVPKKQRRRSSALQKRRSSIATVAPVSLGASLSAPSRLPVDLNRLKEMNAMFLHEMMAKNASRLSMEPKAPAAVATDDSTQSLHSLLRRRQQRRHSLALAIQAAEAAANEAIGEDNQFLAIRRDSLMR